MTGETPTLRRAARVLLLDENSRVLLVRFSYLGESWWAAPGGGLKDDETHEEAAWREVAEETGFELDELGPWVWTREDVFRFEGRFYRQRERYFLASVPAFAPATSASALSPIIQTSSAPPMASSTPRNASGCGFS
jgi:8-oxo-dGTP pyrophosphatase MutT (NUDIX family)